MGCSSSRQKYIPNIPNPLDYWRVHEACRLGNLDDVQRLVSSTRDTTILDPSTGNSPLHIAAKFGHLKIVRYLIDKSANVNSKNLNGDTPLHLALNTDRFDCAIQLKVAGADDMIKNIQGFRACTGSDGIRSYGTAALMSAISPKQIDIALSICETNTDDINIEVYQKAGKHAKNVLKDEWDKQHERRFNAILQLLGGEDKTNLIFSVDDAQAACKPAGIFDALQCF
jgi:ankyrin repeat protein